MEPQNGGLEDDFPLHFFVILRFQPFIFRDVLKIHRCFGGRKVTPLRNCSEGKVNKIISSNAGVLEPLKGGPRA